MSLWVEQTASLAKKERTRKRGPARDAGPEIARIRAEAKAEHPENPNAEYHAFEAKASVMMKGWGANDQSYGMPRETAAIWAQAHSSQIKVCSAAFRQRLSYFHEEDFNQTAIVSALEASAISNQKEQPFEAVFWNDFRFRLEHLCNGSQLAERYRVDEDGNREDHRLCSTDTTPDSLIEKARREMFHVGLLCRALLKHAMQIMSAEEKKAWIIFLSDSRPTTQEVADSLGLTRQGAEYRLKQGLKKVEKFFRNIGITFYSDTGEITSGHRLFIGVEVVAIEAAETGEKAPARKRRAKTVKTNTVKVTHIPIEDLPDCLPETVHIPFPTRHSVVC